MNITNKTILSKLAKYNILESRELKGGRKQNGDNVVTDEFGNTIVVIDDVPNEEISMQLELKKIDLLHSIKNMLKFFTITYIIGFAAILLYFISKFSQM